MTVLLAVLPPAKATSPFTDTPNTAAAVAWVRFAGGWRVYPGTSYRRLGNAELRTPNRRSFRDNSGS